MSRITLKNLPRLKLTELLRRRKMTLKQLLDSFGITTYAGLVNHCERVGVNPPSEAEFRVAHPLPPVNSPQEGVVVLEPPPVVDEISGKHIDPDAPVMPKVKVLSDLPTANDDSDLTTFDEPTTGSQKKLRKKKEANQGE